MPDSIAGAHSAVAPPERPTLGTLIAGTLLACALSAYFLIDTLVLRQPVTQTTATGKSYVLRLSEPTQVAPQLRATGARLVASLTKAKEEAAVLRTEIADRVEREKEYQSDVEDLQGQLAIAERMLSELKQDIEKLPQAFKDTLAVHADSASPRSSR
jgi:chromosome segregation ATPase